jgi:DNA (cytosine-5)-methyltransferase 1
MSTKNEVKYADLFCGLGAFHTAFDRHNRSQHTTKYTCVFACDIDSKVREVYEENYGLKPTGDINTIDAAAVPDFDVLCAGFPCQPFSIAGKRTGFKDVPRGHLFYRILDIIDAKQPSTLLLENVKNLLHIHKGETFRVIRGELEKRGYHVSYKVIDSRYYNSPQSRKRVYLICLKDREYTFNEVKHPIVPVSTIIDTSIATFFDYTSKYTLQECKGGGMMKYKLIHKHTKKGGRQGERVYDLSKCGATICASSGGAGAKTGFYDFDGRIRTLSVQEALRMFGFDTTYRYNSLPKETEMMFYLGNSIVVNVLEELIKGLSFQI